MAVRGSPFRTAFSCPSRLTLPLIMCLEECVRQSESWNILTETSDAQYMACLVTGTFETSQGRNEQISGPRNWIGIDRSGSTFSSDTLKVFNLGSSPSPTRQTAENKSTLARDGTSVVGLCASFCDRYSHFFLNPIDGPPSVKYVCSCWRDKRFSQKMYEQPSILERIRESDSPTHESSFIKLSRRHPKVYMVPAFDCLEGAFMDEWPRARLSVLPDEKPSISSSRDKALIFVALFGTSSLKQ